MESIRAAHNLTIELYPTSWRLVNGSLDPLDSSRLAALFEASAQGITCSPAFTQARQLPAEQLAPADIARVVVGWAPESSNWHLGILLAARPNSGPQVRWCGLASWPSGDSADHMVEAKLAGQSLARIIDRPFHLIPAASQPLNPLGDTHSLPPTQRLDVPEIAVEDESAAEIPEIPVKDPPFEFEHWEFSATPQGYVWQLRGKSLLMIGGRVLTFTVMTFLFFVLGLGARSRGLASVNPEWLPNLGLAVGVVMALLAVYNLSRFLMISDIVLDVNQREVRHQGRFTRQVAGHIPFDRIQYLVLSQSAATAMGRKGKDQPMRIAQEVWLHVYDSDKFRPVVSFGHVEGISAQWDVVRVLQKLQGRRHLHLAHYDTPAHHAALVMARVVDKPVWLDIR